MDLKIRLIKTQNVTKYKNCIDFHRKPCYMATQTKIPLSSESNSDLDSSGEGNRETGKYKHRKATKTMQKVQRKKNVYKHQSNIRGKNLNKGERKASKDKERNYLTVAIVGDFQEN